MYYDVILPVTDLYISHRKRSSLNTQLTYSADYIPAGISHISNQDNVQALTYRLII